MVRFLRDRYLWYIAALAVALSIVIYGHDVAPQSWLPPHGEWHLTYMAMGHLVFLAGVVIAAWRFGVKGGLVVSAAFGLILVPHTIEMAVDLGMTDESLEVGIFVAIGITFSWLIGTRKRAEETLREAEAELKHTIEVVPGIIAKANAHTGYFTHCNPALSSILGFSSEEFLARPFMEFIHPDDRQSTINEVERQLKGSPVARFENRYICKDGAYKWLEWRATAADEKGVVYAAATDITERKRAEEKEKQLQAELYLASRLAAIGELAAGVAHEINNPLTGVIGFSERLLQKSSDKEAKKDLERIHSEGLRIARVVENLLTFARHRQPKRRYEDINDILQKALELRAYELKARNIEVKTSLAPALPKIMVDFYQIQEVLLNIIINAEQAMVEASRRGKLNIKTQQIKGYIRITFTDDGPGISAEHLGQIFNPFFTTRGGRDGTGLGLSICHSIIKEHNGRIYARSQPGKGATFSVELPLTAKRTSKSKAEGKTPPESG